MTTLTRKKSKQDFDHIVHNILELDAEDRAYKILIALTNNAKVSLSPLLNMSKNELKALNTMDFNGVILTFDAWEISEIMNIRRHAVLQQQKQSKDFHLSCLDPLSFEDWKLTPDYRRMTHQDSFLNYDIGVMKITIPSCYTSSTTTQGGHVETSSYKKITSIPSREIEPSFVDTHKTVNKEKMVTSFPI